MIYDADFHQAREKVRVMHIKFQVTHLIFLKGTTSKHIGLLHRFLDPVRNLEIIHFFAFNLLRCNNVNTNGAATKNKIKITPAQATHLKGKTLPILIIL